MSGRYEIPPEKKDGIRKKLVTLVEILLESAVEAWQSTDNRYRYFLLCVTLALSIYVFLQFFF